MCKKAIIIAVFLSFSHGLSAQRFVDRYFHSFFADSSEIDKPINLTYPMVNYSPETSWEFGLSSLFVYYAKGDIHNRMSELNGSAFITLENQYGFSLDHGVYTDKDKWFFLGGVHLKSFPLKYYGIGMETSSDYQALVEGIKLDFKERILREIAENFYIGLEADFQQFSRVNFKKGKDVSGFELPIGSQGSSNLGIGLGIVYDDRHDVLNVRHGNFAELAFVNFAPAFSDFSFSQVSLDTRIFRPVGKHNVVAWQFLGKFLSGDVPFNHLALMGGESMMRGYYYGRYRDNNMMATQLEYRMLPLPLGFTDRVGAAVFTGAGTVFPEFSMDSIKKIAWSAGGGLRFLLFPNKDIYARFDWAFTQEGNGYYLYIGEAF